MKYIICETCKYLDNNMDAQPCRSCIEVVIHGQPLRRTRSNYESASPKRKELEAELASLRARYDALMNCYMLNEQPDSKGRVYVDFGEALVKHETELADKQAIIDEQKLEIDHARRLARYWYAQALEARAECTELTRGTLYWTGSGFENEP